MPRKAKLSIPDWGHARQSEFSISGPYARHRDAAAQHYEEAVRHYRQAAKLYRSAQHEKASQHVHLAYTHHLQVGHHAAEAAQVHLKKHLDNSR